MEAFVTNGERRNHKTKSGSGSIVSSHDESADRKQRIEEIIAACLDAREAGADLSLEEIMARYPEFEKELRDFFENEEFFTSVLGADDGRPYFGNDYEVLKEIGREDVACQN